MGNFSRVGEHKKSSWFFGTYHTVQTDIGSKLTHIHLHMYGYFSKKCTCSNSLKLGSRDFCDSLILYLQLLTTINLSYIHFGKSVFFPWFILINDRCTAQKIIFRICKILSSKKGFEMFWTFLDGNCTYSGKVHEAKIIWPEYETSFSDKNFFQA